MLEALKLQYFAKSAYFVIIRIAQMFLTDLDLFLHQAPGVAVTGNITHGEVDAFFDDQLITTDIHHMNPVVIF